MLINVLFSVNFRQFSSIFIIDLIMYQHVRSVVTSVQPGQPRQSPLHRQWAANPCAHPYFG
jgi:hypothetical protein